VVATLVKLLLIPILACVSTLTNAAEASKSITLIKSSDAQVYDAVIETLDGRLAQQCKGRDQACLKLEIQSLATEEVLLPPPAQDLIVTLGLKARDYADRHLVPGQIINAMIPTRNGHLSQAATDALKHPTLILDQPPIRSLRLIKHLIPGAERIGLLLSRENSGQAASLTQAAASLDLRLVISIVDDKADLGRQLAVLLKQIDVLLALPDIKIHNRHHVTSILLSTYRNRIPLIGFSSAYVKAGAMAALYSSPEDIGSQLADLIDQVMTSGRIVKQVVYPKDFSVSLNSRVARSLGIQLRVGPDKLEQLIRDAEQ
jgi:ABC-type uncharacterized transport system substrate-binding protein